MIPDFKDLAQIYQQRALESLSEEDLAHAKRYRIAAELEALLLECRRVFDYYDCNMEQWSVAEERKLRKEVIAKIDEVLAK